MGGSQPSCYYQELTVFLHTRCPADTAQSELLSSKHDFLMLLGVRRLWKNSVMVNSSEETQTAPLLAAQALAQASQRAHLEQGTCSPCVPSLRQLNSHFALVMTQQGRAGKKGTGIHQKQKLEPNSTQMLPNAGTLYLLGRYFILAIQLQNITMLVTNIIWFDGYK